MRSLFAALFGALLSVGPFSAQAAQDEAAPRHILRSKAVPVVPMAGWMEGGTLRTASGKDAVAKAPASASRYDSKLYKFPSGTIEVLTAEKGGAVLRQISNETQLYVIKGAAEVGVAGAPTRIAAGDTVSRPGGQLRSTADGTIIVAYGVGSSLAQPKSMVVRGKDVKDIQLAQWVRDGKQIASKTPEEFANAPADAQIHLTKRYEFDGNSIRVPYWEKKKGAADIVGAPVTPKEIALLYVWQGQGRFTYGDQVNEVYAGDALEEEGGVPHAWIVRDSMRFIATDALQNAKP